MNHSGNCKRCCFHIEKESKSAITGYRHWHYCTKARKDIENKDVQSHPKWCPLRMVGGGQDG